MTQKFFLLIIISSLLSGCVHSDYGVSQKESSIPWNRPASWEGAGALGGLNMSTGGMR